MSNLRTRAERIKAAGEEARGDWTPTGAPLKVYSYWHKNTLNPPERENFCHFWRVVTIWAPLMRLRNSFLGAPFRGMSHVVKGRGEDIALGFLILTTALMVGLLLFMLVTTIMQEGIMNFLIFAGTALGVIAVVLIGILAIGWILVQITAKFGDWLNTRRRVRLAKEQEAIEEFYDKNGHFPWDEQRKPGIVARFFTGAADFLILIGQVVRVNKWKICPLVNVEEKG